MRITERERCAREIEALADEISAADTRQRPGKKWPLQDTCSAVATLVAAAGRLRKDGRKRHGS